MAVDIGFPQCEPYLPSSVTAELDFMGLHSSVISLSRFFHCSCWVTLKSPQSVSSHQYCVKKDRHIPVLWQAVLCKSSKIVLAGFTAISHCKLISSFLLAVFPQEGFFFLCFVLFYCFANISSSFSICVLDYFSPDEPGCNFLGWIPFHFLPYFWPLQVL